MQRRALLTPSIALLALAWGACHPATAPVDEASAAPVTVAAAATPAPPAVAPSVAAPVDATQVPRIGLEKAAALRASGGAVIVDVRDAGSYAGGHIQGAVNVPLVELTQRLGELPRDKPIITYCA
jgi:3-mercaptopyruvate sulfurtransferase SseA